MTDFIKNLQDKPYETRVRILWGTVIVLGIILFFAWIFGLKSSLGNIKGSSLIQLDTGSNAVVETNVKFASVEYAEQTNNILKIYFNFNNPTDDILNVSKLDDIVLTVDGKQTRPSKITDRQGNAYVQKILSHTQNFGILTFPTIKTTKATLSFDQMSLEKSPADIFVQNLELNFKQLNKPSNIRD